jgi:regulator of sigma E protease
MNLIPIPALDGGRILFVIYEAIFRKPVNKKYRRISFHVTNIIITTMKMAPIAIIVVSAFLLTTIIAIGAIFMVVIMILVTWNDIRRYFL